jgi:hypothetical protein
MAKPILYVVFDPSTGLYLSGYIPNSPSDSVFSSTGYITFTTLAKAEEVAASIGGGTVGTTKPNS